MSTVNGNDFKGMLLDKLLTEGDEGFDGLLGRSFPMAAATDFDISTILFLDLLIKNFTGGNTVYCLDI